MKEKTANRILGIILLMLVFFSVGMMFYGYVTFIKDIIGLLS